MKTVFQTYKGPFGQVEDPPFFEQIEKHWPWAVVAVALFLLAKIGRK